ncbi:MAG: hypothetical protein GX117_12685 [Candidatus Hydrogenedentes bacterium]|nr:hypothetical protein [Candidatus Hydrogenedentota bacterium]
MKRILLTIASFLLFVKRELTTQQRISLWNTLKMWRRGFSRNAIIYYDFKRFDRSLFLTDYEMYTKVVKINLGYTELINNKIAFNDLISSVVRTAKVHAYIEKGRLIPHREKPGIDSVDALKALLKSGQKLIFKGFIGGFGKNVFALSWEDGSFYRNNTPIEEAEVESIVQNCHHYLVCDFVYQAAYARDIFPHSGNTIKFLTMIDPENKEAFIATAMHRFGTKQSAPVDAVGSQGCCAAIDLETGVLYDANRVENSKVIKITSHPDTNQAIVGVQIPNWNTLCEEVCALAKNFSYINYIAWDVLVQEDGFVVLEGNTNSGINLFQSFKPLLLNPRNRKFYRHHGIIRNLPDTE